MTRLLKKSRQVPPRLDRKKPFLGIFLVFGAKEYQFIAKIEFDGWSFLMYSEALSSNTVSKFCYHYALVWFWSIFMIFSWFFDKKRRKPQKIPTMTVFWHRIRIQRTVLPWDWLPACLVLISVDCFMNVIGPPPQSGFPQWPMESDSNIQNLISKVFGVAKSESEVRLPISVQILSWLEKTSYFKFWPKP